MNSDWNIKSRAHACMATGRPFAEGEFFYTLLHVERDGFRREDLCEEAWQARNENVRPFSFWRTKYEPPPAAAPEPVERETAEDLLRRLVAEDDPARTNARFILAVMLERKRLLKPVDARESDEGRLLIYEHAKTGEVLLIRDPGLHLDQVESVQEEVAVLLGAKPRTPIEPTAAPTPPNQASAESGTPGAM